MKDGTLHIRINTQLKERIKEQAEKEGTIMSDLVDRIIRNYLQKERKEVENEK